MIVSPGVDVVSTSGRLNVTLNSDWDHFIGGRVQADDARFLTNGGDFVVGGGSDPRAGAVSGYQAGLDGISFANVRVETGAGHISLRGESNFGVAAHGVVLDSLTRLQTDGGSILINGVARLYAEAGSNGVELSATVIAGGNGSLTVRGLSESGAADTNGIELDGTAVLRVAGGDLLLEGTGGTGANSHGVTLDNTALVEGTGSGDITIHGVSRGSGGLGLISRLAPPNSPDRSRVGEGPAAGTFSGDLTLRLSSISTPYTHFLGGNAGRWRVETAGPGASLGVGDGAAGTLVLDSATLTNTSGFAAYEVVNATTGGHVYFRNAAFDGPLSVRAVSGGVRFQGAVTSAGGVTVLAGQNVEVYAGSSLTAGGNLILGADRDASGSGGIFALAGATLRSTGGDVVLGGGNAADPADLRTSGFAATALINSGNTQPAAVRLDTATVQAAGSIFARGRVADDVNLAESQGVRVIDSALTAGGDVTLVGVAGRSTADSSQGVTVFESSVTSAAGAIRLDGTGGRGTGARHGGVDLRGATLHVAGGAGEINLIGVGNPEATDADSLGVRLRDSTLNGRGTTLRHDGSGPDQHRRHGQPRLGLARRGRPGRGDHRG